MTPRQRRAQSESGLWKAPAFPRPVRSFAGRRAEIDRILAHIDDEMLFLVYGVGGIGKSELVYQVMREIRARPAWSDAIPLLVDVPPGTTMTRTLAQLLAAAGSAPEPRRGQPTEEAHLSEQLAALARLLEERPYLLFIDDVHHLPFGGVAEGLRYLSRHVQRSRLFVASRREIRLSPDAPPPVITTLGPLDAAAAKQMMDALAARMEIPRPNADEMMRATHGSPFHIRRMLVRHSPDEGSLEESLCQLTPAARRVLLAAAVARHRPSVDVMRAAWTAEESFDDTLRDLEQSFLLDVEQGRLVLHDLIREALLARTSPDELTAAHRDAAEMCLEQLRSGQAPSLIQAVDAVSHYLAAGRNEDAWALVVRWHSLLAAAGSDHLLREPLERLRAALPARQVAIDLLIARCLVRASLIEEADAVLARVGDPRTDAEQARYCALAGEVAQRRGDLARAAELFERSLECAPDESARFQARLQLATAATLGGDGERSRQLLDAALADLASPTPQQRARCRWVRTVGWMFEERCERAAEEARQGRLELADTGLDDLANRLAMFETLACIEIDEMERARAVARSIDDAGLRQRVASLYRAIARYADGAARDASAELVEAHEGFRTNGDTINAYLAGYYGTAALAEVGKLGDAQALGERTTQLARDAGLWAPAAQSRAQQAQLAADALQAAAAHRMADEVLAAERIPPRARARAHCAHARGYAIEGDITSAIEHLELARAAVADPDLEAARAEVGLEWAPIDLIGGILERSVVHAERAVEHYLGRSRDFQAARAQMVLAAAYIARGRRSDLLLAERTVAQGRETADRGEMRALQVGFAVLSAALARRANRERAADELLAEALRELDPERGTIYASALLAAIEGGAVAWAVPGMVAVLAHLGFTEAVDCYLVDQHGRRAATDKDVAREQRLRELFVDETKSVIVARGGEVEIAGRPMQCSLLSVLVQARGNPVSPDTLYKRVWGGTEYHPLQHRNALYVAINRLRKSLRRALPGREIIERASNGWRLADDIDACVAVAVRNEPS